MWKSLKLEDVCQIGDGNHSSNYPKASEMVEQGVPFIRAGNIQGGTVSSEDLKFITPEKHLILKKGHLKEGDVLITNRGEIGKTAVVPKIFEGANLNSQIAWLRPDDRLLSQFLFYALSAPEAKASFKSQQSGTALQQLTIRQIKNLHVSYPPLAEQQRIVAKLDAAFAEIDGAIEAANAKVKEVNCLFKKELENTFSNGEFESVNLEKLAKVTSSRRVLKSHYVESGIPFYRTKEIKELANGNPIRTELFISQEQFSGFKNKFGAPQAGDVLITAIGTIGEVYVVQQGDEFYFKDGNILWLRNTSGLNSDYLRYSLINFVDELNSLAHGAAYSALPIQRLKSHKIPIKTLSEQTSSVVKLDALGKLTQDIDKLDSNKILALGVLKSAILAQELRSEAA